MARCVESGIERGAIIARIPANKFLKKPATYAFTVEAHASPSNAGPDSSRHGRFAAAV